MNNHDLNNYFNEQRWTLRQIQMRIEDSKYQDDSLHDAMCEVDEILIKLCDHLKAENPPILSGVDISN